MAKFVIINQSLEMLQNTFTDRGDELPEPNFSDDVTGAKIMEKSEAEGMMILYDGDLRGWSVTSWSLDDFRNLND